MGNYAAWAAKAETVDCIQRPAFGYLFDCEIKFLARDKIDCRRGLQVILGFNRDLGADHPDLQPRIGILQRFCNPHIGGEGRGRGVQYRELVIACERQHVIEFEPRRRRIDQLAVRHKGGRLGEPGREPERADLALGLVAGTGAAIKPIKRGRVEEQGLHHRALSPSAVMRPLASTWNTWSRQNTVRPKKAATNTAKDNASRTGNSQTLAAGRRSA